VIFRQLFDAETWTYTYLLGDPDGGGAVLIDPVLEQVDRDLQVLADLKLSLKEVLETHIHADHVTAASVLREKTGAKVSVSRHGAKEADRHLKDGDVVEAGAVRVKVLETPGHTADSLCFRLHDRVFTGDTMLLRRTGRSDFQNGDPGALYDSVTGKLFSLSEDTLVYPAHDYQGRMMSTIEEEKRLSTVVGKTREEFIAFMNAIDKPKPTRFDVAVPANLHLGKKS